MKWGAIPVGTWTEVDGTTEVPPGDFYRVAHHFQIFLGELGLWVPTTVSGGWDNVGAAWITAVKSSMIENGCEPLYAEFVKSTSGLDTVIDISYIFRKKAVSFTGIEIAVIILAAGYVIVQLGNWLIQSWYYINHPEEKPPGAFPELLPIAVILGLAYIGAEFFKGRK